MIPLDIGIRVEHRLASEPDRRARPYVAHDDWRRSMALTGPVGLDTTILRREIQSMYGRVADSPDTEFHFHRGPIYAATMLGYDADELARLPAFVTASFAGVGNPHA